MGIVSVYKGGRGDYPHVEFTMEGSDEFSKKAVSVIDGNFFD